MQSDTGLRTPLIGKTAQLLIACAIAQSAFGYGNGLSPILPIFRPYSIGSQDSAEYAVLGATVGGALLTFMCGSSLGRKGGVATAAVVGTIGCIVLTSSFSQGQIIAGRVLSAVAGGFIASSAPVWQVEAAETRLRARLVIAQILARSVGGLVARWVAFAYGMGEIRGVAVQPVSWRVPVAMQLVLLAALLPMLPGLPESPRLLVRRGQLEKARYTLAQLRRKSLDDATVTAELQQIQDLIKSTEDLSLTWLQRKSQSPGLYPPQNQRQLKTHAKRRICLGGLLQLFVGLSGTTLWPFFLPAFLESGLGLNIYDSNLILTFASTWSVLCSALSLVLLDHLGRRGSLLLTFSGQALASLVLTVLTSLPSDELQAPVFAAMVAFSFIFLSFSGINSLTAWLYQVEINVWHTRAIGSGVAAAIAYLSSFAGVEIAVYGGYQYIQHGFGALFVGMNVVAVLLVYLLYPETAERSLEWMDRYYGSRGSMSVARDKVAVRRKLPSGGEAMEGVDSVASTMERHNSEEDRMLDESPPNYTRHENDPVVHGEHVELSAEHSFHIR